MARIMMVGLVLLMAASASARASGDGFVLDWAVLEQPLEKALDGVERAHRLGATHFNIPVLLCQDTKTSNEVSWCSNGSYRPKLIELARELKTRGFTTGFLPIVLSSDGQWRGFFEPTDFAAWGASYRARLLEVADIALDVGVSDFVIGTEFNRLYVRKDPVEQAERSAYWRATSAALRAKLGAGVAVIIVANWDQYDAIPFWDASDYIGLSAYYPLAAKDAPTDVEHLTAGWAPWQAKLLAVSDREKRPLYFSEVGYASVDAAAREPWGWTGATDLELQGRLFQAFANAWTQGPASQRLARFQVWALSVPEDPRHDGGFGVFGKPAEAAVAQALANRGGPVRRGDIPVVFTMDDLPMWFVSDAGERTQAYKTFREVLERHHVPSPLLFTNPAYVTESEWETLREWQMAGAVFANHTAHHLPRSETDEKTFLDDVDTAETLLEAHGLGKATYFRYPNLDFGTSAPVRRQTCRGVRNRGLTIMPVSFDTTDWSWNEDYHKASDAPLEKQQIAKRALAKIDEQFAKAPALGPAALVMLIHSSRFSRDYLDHILTRLELQGARWVAPTPDVLAPYRAGADCLPVCVSRAQCF